MNEFETRLHFITTRMAPVLTKEKQKVSGGDSMCCFLFVYFVWFVNPEEDKFMAISLNYRGDVKSQEVNATVESEFKVGLNKRHPALVQDDDMGAAIRNVTMIGDNIGILRVFNAVMYSQRGFVHWYVGGSIEKGDHECEEARQDLGFLEKDYLHVLTEQASDEEDGVNMKMIH